jgi:hypothetical protein
VLRWIALLLEVVIVGLYIIMPIGVSVSIVLPHKETMGTPCHVSTVPVTLDSLYDQVKTSRSAARLREVAFAAALPLYQLPIHQLTKLPPYTTFT